VNKNYIIKKLSEDDIFEIIVDHYREYECFIYPNVRAVIKGTPDEDLRLIAVFSKNIDENLDFDFNEIDASVNFNGSHSEVGDLAEYYNTDDKNNSKLIQVQNKIVEMDCNYLKSIYKEIEKFSYLHNVDRIFAYMAFEGIIYVDCFFEIDDDIVCEENLPNKEEYEAFNDLLSEELSEKLKQQSLENDFDIPTEIRIIYDCKSKHFDTKTSYENHSSVSEAFFRCEKTFNNWFEYTKKYYGKINPL
jgi:hypothetical protein